MYERPIHVIPMSHLSTVRFFSEPRPYLKNYISLSDHLQNVMCCATTGGAITLKWIHQKTEESQLFEKKIIKKSESTALVPCCKLLYLFIYTAWTIGSFVLFGTNSVGEQALGAVAPQSCRWQYCGSSGWPLQNNRVKSRAHLLWVEVKVKGFVINYYDFFALFANTNVYANELTFATIWRW